MQKSPYPEQELTRARIALNAMRVARTLDVHEENWKECLRRIERCWNKVVAHYGRSPKWTGWNSKYERLRRTDELLCYLLNARGAEEHTVNEITEKKPGFVDINPAFGNVLVINQLAVQNGVIEIKSPMPIKIDIQQPAVNLNPVTNRGRTYPVPSTHLGVAVDSTDLARLAELGISFYESAVLDAEAFFVK